MARQNLRVDCPEARQSDEQIGSFTFQKRRNYSIERRMVLVRDRWAASEEAVTTPLYWAWTGLFGPNASGARSYPTNNALFVDRRSESSNNSTVLLI